MTIWRMRIACCITKATNMHSVYPILIASAQQHWLHDSSSLLPYTYIAYLLINPFQSSFYANRILPSSDLFGAVKSLVDYL
jgi:hypothetical protein